MSSHDEVHISPNSTYFAVFAALIVLTVVTAWVAFYDFGWANDLIALGIAFTKASLVVLFFMHIKYGTRLNKMLVVASLAWLAIMFGLTLMDYTSRASVVPESAPVPGAYDSFEADRIAREAARHGAESGASHGDESDDHH